MFLIPLPLVLLHDPLQLATPEGTKIKNKELKMEDVF
jgi:hypothetical protein